MYGTVSCITMTISPVLVDLLVRTLKAVITLRLKKARFRQTHGSVLRVLTDAMESGDRIFAASTAGENVDVAGEG